MEASKVLVGCIWRHFWSIGNSQPVVLSTGHAECKTHYLGLDLDAHAAGGAGDHFLDSRNIFGVHVFGFGLGNFG